MSTTGSTSSSKGELVKEKKFLKGRMREKIILGVVILAGIALVIGLAVGIHLSRSDTTSDNQLERARTFLELNILIDGHNDLPWQYRQYAKNKVHNVALDQDTREFWPVRPMADEAFPVLPPQTDIPRLRTGRVGAQWWAAFCACKSVGKDAVRQGFDQVDVIHKIVDRYPESFVLATSTDEIRSAFSYKRIASLIGLEGGHMIGNSLGNLRMYYKLGVRYMTLTHSCDIDWADNYNADTNGGISTGLTSFGQIVVQEMNRLGMIVDISHVSKQTMIDAIDTSIAPVIFSHSSVFTLCNHYRNVQDDVLDKMVDHIEYVRDNVGIDYVAIGADYDGVDLLPQGLEDVSTYPTLFAELEKRGWTENDLKKLAGENFMRVFKAVEKARDNLSSTPPYENIINNDDIRYPNCTTGF